MSYFVVSVHSTLIVIDFLSFIYDDGIVKDNLSFDTYDAFSILLMYHLFTLAPFFTFALIVIVFGDIEPFQSSTNTCSPINSTDATNPDREAIELFTEEKPLVTES